MASDWLQPLFETNGVVFSDIEDIENLTASLTSLYDRVDSMRMRGESLYPFELKDEVMQPLTVIEWAAGLHGAVTLQEDLWYPDDDEADWVPDQLKREVNLNIQCLSTLVDPSQIPEIVKDPIPFQRNVLSECPGWNPEVVRETWDEELMALFRCFSLARLNAIVDSLQRYSTAYDEEEVVVIDLREGGNEPSGPVPED